MFSTRSAARGRAGGFTMVELIISTAILVALSLMVATLAQSATQTNEFAGKQVRISEVAQDELGEMRIDIGSSVRLMTNDAYGTAYAGRLDYGPMTQIGNWRLPALDSTGTFRKDTSTLQKTGNTLFFVRLDRADDWIDPIDGVHYRTDTYRFVFYFLRKKLAGALQGNPIGVDLVRWVSVPLADARQVEAITNLTHRVRLLQHLLAGTNPSAPLRPNDRCRYLWRFGADVAAPLTFQEIHTDGSLVDLSTAMPAWRVPPQYNRIRTSRLWDRGLSVATNWVNGNMGVGRFAIPHSVGDGFPHGFETQIIGPASARQVMVHLSLVARNLSGPRAYVESSVIADARDL